MKTRLHTALVVLAAIVYGSDQQDPEQMESRRQHRVFRRGSSGHTVEYYLQLPDMEKSVRRSHVAHITFTRLQRPVASLGDFWRKSRGDDLIAEALESADTDRVISVIALLGEVLHEASEKRIPFPTPEGVVGVCSQLERVFDADLLPEYVMRLKRRDKTRERFALSVSEEDVLYETPLAHVHFICPYVSLRIKQAAMMDRMMRYISRQSELRLAAEEIDEIEFPHVSSSDSLEENLHRLHMSPIHHLIFGVQIEYVDSFVRGTGITRDWFTGIYEQLFDPVESKYFAFDAAEGVYRIHSDQIDNSFRSLGQFRSIGIALGLSILEMVPTGAALNFGLLKFLLAENDDVVYTLADLQEDDAYMYKALEFLKGCDWTSANPGDISCEEAFGEERLPMETVPQFVDRMIQNYVLARYRSIYVAIKNGFQEIIPFELLRGGLLSPKELRSILKGEQADTMTVTELQEHITFESRDDEEDNLQTWFWDFLNAHPLRPLKLIRFITGLKSLPVGGYKILTHPVTVYVYPFDAKAPFPEARLCFNQLILPRYPRKELLDRYLAEAIENLDVAVFL